MSNTIGNTKDLDASRTEALQGLLSSLGHTNDDSSSDAPLVAEELRKLSERSLDDTDLDPTPDDQPNQLVNEDGLPIIDISEPVDEDSQTSTSRSLFLEQDLIPFSLLPPDERKRRRRKYDRILDLLEEEERFQQLQEERDAEEERREAIRKRKESVKAELGQLKAAQELQKKMGQALVRHVKGKENEREEEVCLKSQDIPSAPQKSISFADAPATKADEKGQRMSIHQSDWGDVTPGRLRAQSRISLMSTAQAQRYPMKMRVVERRPTASPTPSRNDADSDDESTCSAGNPSPPTESDSSDEEHRSSSSNNGLSDDEPLEEGFDYDTARHHREIALEYHEKRHAIGVETAKAMAADDYEEHGTPNGPFPLSRFRADRMAAAYDKSHGPISTSMGHTVIPASRQRSLRNSVRLGKLKNDQLVGDSGESGSEDETVKEVIQMLQTGSIHNAGPDLKPSSVSTIAPSQNFNGEESPSIGTPTDAHGAKLSKFKSVRAVTETADFQDDNSGDNAWSRLPISSVPKRRVTRSTHFPVNKPPPRSSVKTSEPAHPMIIDSPSFPKAASTPTATIPSFSPLHPTPSPHLVRPEHPPIVKSSAMHSSMMSRVSPRDPLSAERPISKFMAERKK